MSDTGPGDADFDEDAQQAKLQRYMHLLPVFSDDAPPAQEAHWPALDPAAARDRALGCMLGLAVGDALGAAVEFQTRDKFPPVTNMRGGGTFKLAPGEWTDDTTMALCLGQSLFEHGTLDQYDFMTRLRAWLERGENTVHGKCFDIGTTTRAAIESFIHDDDPAAGAVNPESAGNGSLVRLAPLAVFCANDIDQARFLANKQSRATHGTIECLDACELFAAQLVDALSGADKVTATRPRVMALSPNVLFINGGEWKDKPRDAISSSGYVVHTLEAALWAVWQTKNFRDAVLLAVNLGDDADSVGAVAGQLAGALYGASSIPADWLAKLAWRTEIEKLATDLLASGTAAA
ncbi:MAG TPA: ADP-ribosylglycohydrolase family protein [Stellaceae bacterium]|jgi:ADP-ribosyl-[dinitrogen reductase] hydrolase